MRYGRLVRNDFMKLTLFELINLHIIAKMSELQKSNTKLFLSVSEQIFTRMASQSARKSLFCWETSANFCSIKSVFCYLKLFRSLFFDIGFSLE